MLLLYHFELNENLQPLVTLIEEKYIEFLPKLNYPVRVGEHPNTAFGMSFARKNNDGKNRSKNGS